MPGRDELTRRVVAAVTEHRDRQQFLETVLGFQHPWRFSIPGGNASVVVRLSQAWLVGLIVGLGRPLLMHEYA